MKLVRKAVFNVLRFFVKIFYRKPEVVGALPEAPCIIVGNHTQMNGPIVGELFMPSAPKIWCAGQMMHIKEVPSYAFYDFWRNKPKRSRWFYKALSYIIAPLSVCVFNSARTIAVYHDKRIVSTFRETVKAMKAGENILIFPEKDSPHNHIVCDFQEGFIDVARLYCKQTKKPVSFVPAYLAPTLHKVVLGQPIAFDPEARIEEERERICTALMDSITALALELPPHTVVPYNNQPRKTYPKSKE